MAYEDYHVNADDVKLDGDPNIRRTVPPSPSGGFDPDNLNTSTNTPTDNDVIITKESSTWYVKAFSKVWDYIKSKIGIDNSHGSANKFLNEQGTFTVVNSGKKYDLEFNNDLDEVTLTENNVDKTTLPLVAEYVGTRADWNLLSAAEKVKYRILHFTDDSAPSQTMLSYVGMVIHSTTLNSEAMVKQIYGNDTSWILHNGYVLRGSASGVLADNAVKDGGEDTVTLTIQQMPAHGHPVLRQQWYGSDTVVSSSTGAIYSWKSGAGTGGSTSMSYKKSNNGNDTLDTGGGQSHNNMQSYKNVFIWERIS